MSFMENTYLGPLPIFDCFLICFFIIELYELLYISVIAFEIIHNSKGPCSIFNQGIKLPLMYILQRNSQVPLSP